MSEHPLSERQKQRRTRHTWRVCQSPHPRPEFSTCLYPECGRRIGFAHWACRQHWELYPRQFVCYANHFKGFWQGDPSFDRFAQTAHEIGLRLAAGEVCTWSPPYEREVNYYREQQGLKRWSPYDP